MKFLQELVYSDGGTSDKPKETFSKLAVELEETLTITLLSPKRSLL